MVSPNDVDTELPDHLLEGFDNIVLLFTRAPGAAYVQLLGLPQVRCFQLGGTSDLNEAFTMYTGVIADDSQAVVLYEDGKLVSENLAPILRTKGSSSNAQSLTTTTTTTTTTGTTISRWYDDAYKQRSIRRFQLHSLVVGADKWKYNAVRVQDLVSRQDVTFQQWVQRGAPLPPPKPLGEANGLWYTKVNADTYSAAKEVLFAETIQDSDEGLRHRCVFSFTRTLWVEGRVLF